MIVKIFVRVLYMSLVVASFNLRGSQGHQTTKRAIPSTLLQTVLMTRRTTPQRAMPSTLLHNVLLTERTTTQRAKPTTVLHSVFLTGRTTTQRAKPTTVFHSVFLTGRTTTQRAKPTMVLHSVFLTGRTTIQRAMSTTVLQTVLMARKNTTRLTLRRSTPTILDNKLGNGLHSSTPHDSTPGKEVADVSNRTSQSAVTHVAEVSTITTPSLQEAAMKLFIWNLTAKATGHNWTDHLYTIYEDYLHFLYEHCAREKGWKYCLEDIPNEVPLCKDIRANKTYNGSIQRHPYIFEYFDYYNIDILTLSCQQYDEVFRINDGFNLAYDIVVKVIGSLGLLGNGLSIITIYTADKELTSTSLYLIALAISDSVYVLGKITILDGLECEMTEIVHEVLLCISAWFLVVITVERFKSIYNPYTVQDHCNPCTAKIYVAIIPVICSTVGIIMYLSGVYEQLCSPLTLVTYITYTEHHDASQKIEVTWFVLTFISPFLLILTLNMAIVRILYKAAKQRQEMSNLNSDLDKEKKITKTLAIVTIAYLVLVGPHHTYHLLYVFAFQADDTNTESIYYTIPTVRLLQMVNYCINFLIYTLCGSKYRDSFLKLLKRIKCKHHTHVV